MPTRTERMEAATKPETDVASSWEEERVERTMGSLALAESEHEDVTEELEAYPFTNGDSGLQEADSGEGEDSLSTERAFTTDVVRAYFSEISRHDVPTPEEEANLAKRIAAGTAAKKMIAGAERPPEKLQRIVDEANAARETLYVSNLRLVISYARKYAHAYGDLSAAIQEGNLGLSRAIDKFDHTKGYKFSTYAVWWIRQNLQRGMSRSDTRTIRVPNHAIEIESQMYKYEKAVEARGDKRPSIDETAKALGVNKKNILDVKRANVNASLDKPVTNEADGDPLHNFIADVKAPGPEDETLDKLAMGYLQRVMHKHLSETEHYVLRARYGFDEEKPATLQHVADELGLTREGVRKLQMKAQRRLTRVLAETGVHSLTDIMSLK